MKVKVYIASPLAIGDKEQNVRNSFEMGNKIIDMGANPYCPLYNYFLDAEKPRDGEFWLQLDFDWLRACDVVLRMPGESVGADMETALANEIGIPVVYSIEQLAEYFGLIEQY